MPATNLATKLASRMTGSITQSTGHGQCPRPVALSWLGAKDIDMDKLAALHEILQLDPTNAFARYGLAMEHVAQNNSEAALAEFATLIGHNPDYVPAYQMSAQTMMKLGRNQAALDRLDAGIATANRTGNQHALAEMEAMREELGLGS